jgi:general secretion pathway protein D
MKTLKRCWLSWLWQFQFSRGKSFLFILFSGLLLCSPPGLELSAAGESSNYNTTQYKVISLSNIPAEQGIKYLTDLRLGTVSQIRGTNALLVTALPYELSKADVILRLVDAKEQFVVRLLFPASRVQALPSNERIATVAAAGLPEGISIGSFSRPPSDTASTRAIIDIHNNMVIVVAQASRVDTIVSAIEAIVGPGLIDKNRSAAENSGPTAGGPRSEPGFNTRITSSVVGTAQAPSEVSSVSRANVPGTPLLVKPADSRLASVDANLSDISDLIEDLQSAMGGSGAKAVAQQRSEPAPATAAEALASSYELPPIPDGEAVLSETLPEKLDIVYLLGLAGAYLNLDFVYDPAKVKGDVTLMLQGKLKGTIKVKDLYPLLETVLKFKGFVMTRHKGNLVTVVPQDEALDIDPTLLEAADGTIEHGDMVVTRTFRLEHIDTASASNLLTNMKLGVNISEIAEAKTLIVTEFVYRMPRVEALLALVDRPGEPRKFRFRQLRYTMARNLAPKLQTLAEQLGTVSITIAEEPAEETPTVARLPNESEANYRRRLTLVRQRAAQLRAQRAAARGRQAVAKPAETAEPTVYLDADERTNRILMIGLEKQLKEVQELIDALDVEQQDLRTLGIYKIKHVGAEEVRKKLEELGMVGPKPETTPTRLTSSTTAARPPVTKPEAVTTEYGATTTEALLEEPQVVVIEATNSLLVNATPEQHVRIATIINYVDSQTELEEMPYQLYPLENQSPDHLAEVLQSLIQETVQTQDKEGKIEQQVVKRREEEIVIVPDPNTFSLIVYASKKNQGWIANLIEKLDKRRPQVLIDVTLVEISKADAFNFDLNLIQSFPNLISTSGLAEIIIPGTETVPPITSRDMISKLNSGGRDRFIDLQSDSGSGVGFYGDRHINALLTAMQEKNYGRILAKPKILVNDNMEGVISTTDTTYVTRKTSIPVTSGAAGQETTLIQTGEEFDSFDAGITLTITPHISEGDLLRLDINLTRSDFGNITGTKPPDTTQSEINTKVTVPNGSTIILGGLLKLNQSKGGTKVPILGDIPLVGGLFRGIDNSDIQKKLYVFVKAEVIRPEDTAYARGDLERISERNRRAFEQHEEEFQKYQDWPGIKPKPIDPLKVLEAE